MILAIDPGTRESGCVLFQNSLGAIASAGVRSNEEIIEKLREPTRLSDTDVLVYEQIESFGKAVGFEVFRTVWWSGRFCEAWMDRGGRIAPITRRRVKEVIAGGNPKAKDAQIRQCLIDLYGGQAQTKKGGALERVKSHSWAALAVGVVFLKQSDTFVDYNWTGDALSKA
jgi:hypothetical protein